MRQQIARNGKCMPQGKTPPPIFHAIKRQIRRCHVNYSGSKHPLLNTMDSDKKKFGRYTLCRLLARGGMGEVYLATLEGVAGFEKRCVIKKIRPDLVSDSTFVERFLNEGKTLVALTQSNIVQIFDMGVYEGEYYLAMEYISGADLRQLLKRKTGEMPVSIAIAVVKEVLKGLGYAHRATDDAGNSLGIVHRDVSPSNILISDEGDVKLIDFGIAKANTIETMSGVVQGKFSYMSPEQARGEHLDARADLFSLAIVLYEMLCGVRPFDGKSDLQSLERIKFDNPRPILEYRSDLDPELSAILDKGLTKNIDERFQNADEFYDALEDYATSHKCIAGQREVIAYFKPFISEETEPTRSYKNVNDALEAMLNAQEELAFQTTATQTLHSAAEPQKKTLQTPENATPGPVLTPLPNTPTPGLTPSSRTPSINSTSTSDSFRRISEAIERVREEEDEALSPVNGPLDEETILLRRKRRLYMKIRYGVFGGLFAVLVSAVIILLYLYLGQSSPDLPLPKAPQPLDLLKPSADVSGQDLWGQNNGFFAAASDSQKELPFYIQTHPENAAFYIAEGAYKELERNTFKLIPGRDLEVDIQSKGYETCIFRVEYDSEGGHSYRNANWSNCKSVSTKYSAANQRFEVDVYLLPEQPAPAETVQANESQPPQMDAPEAAPIEDSSAPAEAPAVAADEAQAPQNTAKPKDNNKNSAPSKTKPRDKAADKPAEKQQAFAISSNIDANIIIHTEQGKETYNISSPVSAAPGTAFEIEPIVSGRKIAIPYKGKFSSQKLDVHFCEAKIRINESYAEGDPAPYQLADILLDGNIIAKHADAVSLVLPCKKYELSARIHAGSTNLNASQTLTLSPDAPSPNIALTLH